MTDQPAPTLAEILAACLAVQAIYAERDAAEAQLAAGGIVTPAGPDCVPEPEPEPTT